MPNSQKKVEVKVSTRLLCLAGALQSNQQSMDELCVAGGDDSENFG
jgi:hypothetical protein